MGFALALWLLPTKILSYMFVYCLPEDEYSYVSPPVDGIMQWSGNVQSCHVQSCRSHTSPLRLFVSSITRDHITATCSKRDKQGVCRRRRGCQIPYGKYVMVARVMLLLGTIEQFTLYSSKKQ
ncbi:uncharacterized protein F5891DRAFT_1070142 [Suillus fuscotomentosus]|uniref:Secreted protein n=1 Tax=Suillus fuscotomentosus TaxID=1912939 RepID=A0AAD4DR85_9AGAM|nr:uncharacterized protein F5891DRAFT_1070142 [Suillus fuscotomentosus]KAG1891546.1 hypothetical protein F5891DRAFT_1070142 [Suillus fuscotomentosus]